MTLHFQDILLLKFLSEDRPFWMKIFVELVTSSRQVLV